MQEQRSRQQRVKVRRENVHGAAMISGSLHSRADRDPAAFRIRTKTLGPRLRGDDGASCVIPAQAGIHFARDSRGDPRFRGDDTFFAQRASLRTHRKLAPGLRRDDGSLYVIPPQAGIQRRFATDQRRWVPACAGTTAPLGGSLPRKRESTSRVTFEWIPAIAGLTPWRRPAGYPDGAVTWPRLTPRLESEAGSTARAAWERSARARGVQNAGTPQLKTPAPRPTPIPLQRPAAASAASGPDEAHR